MCGSINVKKRSQFSRWLTKRTAFICLWPSVREKRNSFQVDLVKGKNQICVDSECACNNFQKEPKICPIKPCVRLQGDIISKKQSWTNIIGSKWTIFPKIIWPTLIRKLFQPMLSQRGICKDSNFWLSRKKFERNIFEWALQKAKNCVACTSGKLSYRCSYIPVLIISEKWQNVA
jgi:hypothetical protein